MFVTLVAVLCHQLAGAPIPVCLEEIVADSGMDARLTWMSCQVGGEIGISKWLAESPKYRTGWTLQKWKCVPGRYVIPGGA